MHWGEGQIIEEARYEGEYAHPAIQLMRFDTGPAVGSLTLRFCHFNARGQFQRSPMMVSDEEIDRLAEAVSHTPEIQRLLRRIAGTPSRGRA